MYHTITAAKPLTFKKQEVGCRQSGKMKLILLSFHERFLNFNENMGVSDTSSHENRQTNINR